MDAPGLASYFKTNPVYVADGLPPTTGTNVTALLTSSDGIKVAILPEGQATEPLARQVLASQPDGTVVLVASGEDVAAVANAMPAGELSDLLARAQNVSTNGVDTVRTLITNVHTWQEAHPQTVTATTQPADPVAALVPVGAVSLPVVIAVVATLVFFRRRRRLSETVKGTAPRDIRPLVADLMGHRAKISNRNMQRAIENLCEYVEAYFRRVKNDPSAREALRSQLSDAVEVARTYRAVEAEPFFYRDPDEARKQGRLAIDGLASSVLESVRSNNARALIDYSVSTNILKAQKYR